MKTFDQFIKTDALKKRAKALVYAAHQTPSKEQNIQGKAGMVVSAAKASIPWAVAGGAIGGPLGAMAGAGAGAAWGATSKAVENAFTKRLPFYYKAMATEQVQRRIPIKGTK